MSDATEGGRSLDIFAINADGSDESRLTDNLGHDHQPAWSPDGSYIAYASGEKGSETTSIWLMKANGSGREPLSAEGWLHVGVPRWSPDGEQIAVAGDRGDGTQIYLIDVATGELMKITDEPDPTGVGGAYQPDWSPDGRRIVHMRIRFDDRQESSSQLYVMNADGTDVTLLPTGAATESGPRWSPDGSKVAFITGRDGATEIYVMNIDGTGLTRLTDHPGDDFTPAWSPDGSQLAFASDREGDGGMYVANSDGSAVIRLTDNGSNPDWTRPGPEAVEVPDHGVPVCPIDARFAIANPRESDKARLVIEGNPSVVSALNGMVTKVEINEERGWASVTTRSSELTVTYRFYVDSSRESLRSEGSVVASGDVIGGAHELLDLEVESADEGNAPAVAQLLKDWGCREGLPTIETLQARLLDGSVWEVRLGEPIEVVGGDAANGYGELEVDGEIVSGAGVLRTHPDFTDPQFPGSDPPVLLEEIALPDGRHAEHWDLAPSHENNTYAYALWVEGPGEHMYFSSGQPIEQARLIAESLRIVERGTDIDSVWFASERVALIHLQATFFLMDPSAPLRDPEVRINTTCRVDDQDSRCEKAELEVPSYTPGTRDAFEGATLVRIRS